MLVEIIGKRGEEQLITDSRKVAENFEKRHDHVMRDIETLLGGLPKNGDTLKMFHKVMYVNEQNGQKYPMYLVNRDGFTLLAMGFTGKKALEWKLKYIDAFNKMEDILNGRILNERHRAELERGKGIISRHILTDTIKLKIADSANKKFVYPNYTKLIYKVLFGKTMAEMREFYKPEGRESVRDHMSPEELLAVSNMEGLISGLINYGWSYDQIKEFVSKQPSFAN